MTFAWDGLSFEIPGSWELLALEHVPKARTARFADMNGSEKLFLRWSEIKGRFNVASHLGQILRAVSKDKVKTRFVVDEGWKASPRQKKKLRKLARSSTELRFDGRVELPGAKKALKAMNYAAFSWEEEGGRGQGAVGFSPASSKAFLFHFIGASPGEERTVWSSFADRADADEILWSAHGLRFRAPKEFVCTGLGYDPKGLFQVRLKKERTVLYASRWSLANVLLKRSTLGQFFAESFKKTRRKYSVTETEGEFKGHECLRFRPAFASLLSRALARVRKAVPLGAPHFLGGLLWRCTSSNRIVSFYALGPDEDVWELSEEVASTAECCKLE